MHKVRYLDGLRGIAAFIVVLHHFAAAFYPAAYLGLDITQHSGVERLLLTTPLGLLIAGNFSVCIFFILSGYVLSAGFFRTGDSRTLASLAYRRYFRLLPPVLLSGLVAWALLRANLFPVRETALLTGSSRWLAGCWNFTPSFKGMLGESLFGVFFRHQANYNNVLWTMTYEFFGSFLVFAVAGLFGKTRGRYLAYAVILFAFLHTYYLAFFLGLILADIERNTPGFFRGLSSPFVTIAFMLAGFYLGAVPPFPDVESAWYAWTKAMPFSRYSPEFWHIAGALFVMLAVMSSKALQKFFAMRLPLWLGKVSFSMYAVHVIVLGSLSCFLFIALHSVTGYNTAALITLGVTVLVSLVLAELVNKYIDEPGVRMSRRIQERFFPLDL
jgi:peptidoglycan/LPS O-acetylase OafA/YrhL